MLSFDSYLQQLHETVLSIGLNPKHEDHREKHRDEMHSMLKNAYAKVDGGYSGFGHGSKAESDAIHDDISHSAIKAIKRGGKLTAIKLYKKSFGRKAIGGATDGTEQGKKDYNKANLEDHEQKRAWGEVSGAPEHLARKAGFPVVHNSLAAKLTGKNIESKDDNGEHYTRKIGKDSHKKVIVGHPKMD